MSILWNLTNNASFNEPLKLTPFYNNEVFITGESSKDSSHRCKTIHKLTNISFDLLLKATKNWKIR
tara:strand:- start:1658 stop:1855 length:198 start_codon:yes stop_codon:yes gene_type:complete